MTSSQIHQLPSPTANASHCLSPFWGVGITEKNSGNTLAYRYSDGPWFERLCYRLAWRAGYTMRYFGRAGQEQYGADLVGTSPAGTTLVWQCKNLQAPPTREEMTKWVKHFNDKWLVEQKLPAPVNFILCCPQPMRDAPTDATWLTLARDMQEKWGVVIELWDRIAIDEMLRSAPDIAADLFGDANTEAFCGTDIWPRRSPFRPLSFSTTLHSYPERLRRYGLSLEKGRIYVEDGRQECLAELSAIHAIALVRGAPGCGKTYDILNYCRQRAHEGWRTYYLNLTDLGTNASNLEVADGIRRRLSLPTIFILDDCHGHEARVTDIIDHLAESRVHSNLHILCLCRHVQLDRGVEREGSQEWHEALEAEGAVLDIEQNDAYLKGYVEFLRPDFHGLSQSRWQRLSSLTGRNLLLLDVYLALGEPPEHLDREDRQDFYKSFRQYVLGGVTQNAEHLRRLAAIGQFELAPPAAWVGGDSAKIAAETPGFLVQAGWPRRLHFVHSSAAELIFHALMPAPMLATNLGELIQDYLTRRIAEARVDLDLRTTCLDEAEQILATRPILLTPAALSNAHCHWLSAPTIVTPLLEWSRDIGGHPLVSRALQTLTTAEGNNDSISRPYADALTLWLRQYLTASEPILPEKIYLFRRSVVTLARNSPSTWIGLEERIAPAIWLQAIKTQSALPELFLLIQYATPSFARCLLNSLNTATIEQLINKTRCGGQSIGTLHSAFNTLGKNSPDLAAALEAKMNPRRWLELIAANGTLYELFRFLEHSSPHFAGRLLDALSSEDMSHLIDKTRSSGRSIGTLGLALFELRKNSPDIAATLETKLDPRRWLDLIATNGTVFELFRFLQSSSPHLAGRLLEALSSDELTHLTDKTRSSGRSIATLDLALFTLWKNSPGLAAALEAKLDPRRWLDLIATNGTVFELFRFLQHSSPDFAGRLLEALGSDELNQLIDKTRSSGRSIGTLDLTLFALRKNSPDIAAALETKLDPRRWLDLIATNGTVFELFRFLQRSSPHFAGRLLEALSSDELTHLIDKTRSSGRSIGTLNLTLRHLRNHAPKLGLTLEEQVGEEGFTALIFGCGTLGSFADLGKDFSEDFRPRVLACCAARPDVEWDNLVYRSTFFELAEFLARSQPWATPWPSGETRVAALAKHAPTVASHATWYALYSGRQKIVSFSNCPWHTELLAACEAKVQDCTAADLPDADDLCELANAAPLLLDARPDLAQELAFRMENALMKADRQAGIEYARWAPQLIFHLRHPVFPEKTVNACLDAVLVGPVVSIFLEQGNHVQSFLWLWNALAIHWERFSPGASPTQAGQAFRNYRNDAFWQRLVASWTQQVTQQGKFTDIAPLLQLAGLFALLQLKLPPQKQLTWGSLGALRFNPHKALDNPKLGFVPTWFLQLGLRTVLTDRNAFSPERCKMMREKLANYGQATPPVTALAAAMEKYAMPTTKFRFPKRPQEKGIL